MEEKKKKDSRTRYVEVGGDFAVGQCEPDEAETHAHSSRDVGKIVSFAWNRKLLNATVLCWNDNV